jgi:diguanylate cyclase (GGDEF)-like protein
MAAAGDIVGFVGLPDSGSETPPAQRRVLATAATLLAVSLRNADLFRAVRDSGLKDGLTGCFNRTHAIEVIETELRRARRSLLPLSIIMFDIDRFKTINDRYGHLGGDAVLAAIGQCMRDVLRVSDLKCRYGGEEFLVVLPDTPIEGALRVADNLRRELAARPIRWQNDALTITASFGVAAAKPAESDTQALVGRADSALYRAKEQGRNRVCLSTEPAVA